MTQKSIRHKINPILTLPDLQPSVLEVFKKEYKEMRGDWINSLWCANSPKLCTCNGGKCKNTNK